MTVDLHRLVFGLLPCWKVNLHPRLFYILNRFSSRLALLRLFCPVDEKHLQLMLPPSCFTVFSTGDQDWFFTKSSTPFCFHPTTVPFFFFCLLHLQIGFHNFISNNGLTPLFHKTQLCNESLLRLSYEQLVQISPASAHVTMQ